MLRRSSRLAAAVHNEASSPATNAPAATLTIQTATTQSVRKRKRGVGADAVSTVGSTVSSLSTSDSTHATAHKRHKHSAVEPTADFSSSDLVSAVPATGRKGAVRRVDVGPSLLAALNTGSVECASLAEMLTVDFSVLICTVLPTDGPALSDADVTSLKSLGVKARMSYAARMLCDRHVHHASLATHRSDIVRGWAAYVASMDQRAATVALCLDAVKRYADDANAGVREFAMMAARDTIAADPLGAIAHLTSWATDASANVRRFASEATRPCGVWIAHIPLLKASPELGLPILEPLRADPSLYVQKSVANWLNDASKSNGQWVRSVCARWRREEEGSKATEFICKRALRTLAKK